MSRERFIHPEIVESEDWHSLGYEARVLFVSLIALADDVGRGKASERSLIGTVFAGRNVPLERFRKWRDELIHRGMAKFYIVGGSPFYELPNWAKYQNPRYVKQSKIPAYQPNYDLCTEPVQNLADSAGISQNLRTGRVGKGREGKGGEGASADTARTNGDIGFSDWWEELRPWFKAANRRLAYKQDALAHWKKHGLAEYADLIIERTKKQRQHYADAVRSGQDPPPPQDPHRYLKNRRYNDETP